MAKGFGGAPGNMQAIMKQAQKMQQDLQKAQAEAETLTAEGSAGGGMVKASVNGKNQVLHMTIAPEVVNPDDIEMLQDLAVAAVNDALEKVQNEVQEKLSSVTGGLNIPGLG